MELIGGKKRARSQISVAPLAVGAELKSVQCTDIVKAMYHGMVSRAMRRNRDSSRGGGAMVMTVKVGHGGDCLREFCRS